MKNKGFTLIELLAVIVILAIIALIATPIILGIINDAKEESDERSVELYASAIKNALANHQLMGNNPISGTGYTSDSLEEILDVDYDGDVDCSVINILKDGKVYLSGCKINEGIKEYSYEKGLEKVCELDDSDDDGVASLSDIITCGTELFYVMDNKDNKITMLAMYNLNVGNNPYPQGTIGIQNENVYGFKEGLTTYGTVAFSNDRYWESMIDPEKETTFVYNNQSNIYQYVSAYQNYLVEEMGVSSASATLISYEQLEDLGCSGEAIFCSSDLSWLSLTAYWTGFGIENYIPYACHSGNIYCDSEDYQDVNNFGVRPVITISENQIQN